MISSKPYNRTLNKYTSKNFTIIIFCFSLSIIVIFFLFSLNVSEIVFKLNVFLFIIIILFGLSYGYLQLKKNVLLIIYFLSNAGFILFPVFYYVLTNDASVAGVSIKDWSLGIFLQTIFLLCWLFGYIFISKISLFKKIVNTLIFKRVEFQDELIVVLILWFLSILSAIWILSKGLIRYGAFDVALTEGEKLGVPYIFSFFQSFLFPSSIALFLVLKEKKIFKSFIFRTLSFCGLLSFLVFYFIKIVFTSQRILIIKPFILMFAGFVLMKRLKKRYILNIVLLFLLLIYFGDILTKYRQLFFTYRNEPLSIVEQIRLIRSFKEKADFSEALYHLASRCDLAQNSSLLFYASDKFGFITYRPYIGSIFAWIPRLIWPNKPFPGSYDGTFATSPPYFIGYLKRGIFGGYHSATAPAAGIMYWQFGWFGVILGGFIIGAFWRFFTVSTLKNLNMLSFILFLIGMSQIIVPGDSFDRVIFFFIRYFVPLLILNRIVSKWKK